MRDPDRSSERMTFLRHHPIFGEIGEDALAQLGHYAKTRKYKKGALIFSKGDPGDRLLAVMTGTVKIGISSANGRSTIFNMVGAGELFGEIAFLDGSPRTADAIANTDCDILSIEKRDFLPFMQSQPLLMMKFIDLLCKRLRWVSEHVEQIGLPDLQTRLAKTLIRLAERDVSHAKNGKVSVTQQELSEMIGMSRESINRQLRSLGISGVVTSGTRRGFYSRYGIPEGYRRGRNRRRGPSALVTFPRQQTWSNVNQLTLESGELG